VSSLPTARSDHRRVLEAFAKVLGREAHNLTRWPELLWQQLYNRLQWADGLRGTGVITPVLAPELEERSRPGARLWLHSLTRFRESEAVVRTLSGHTLSMRAVAYSPDGTRIVSGSSDGTLKLWDAGTGAELATLSGHTSAVNAVACSPDGTRIVSGSDDETLKVSDAEGVELAILTGHTGGVTAVGYSPDGTRIVSGSNDHTLKVWNAETKPCIATLLCLGPVRGCDCDPQGTRICCGDESGTVYILELMGETPSARGDRPGRNEQRGQT
jgi:WD40 repeat protein